MTDEKCGLWEILNDLEILRDRENQLIRALTTLIDSPDGPDVPEHIRRVLKLANDAFKDNAAQFLICSHLMLKNRAPIVVAQTVEGAQQVEDLLGRIIHGICV